MHLHLEDLPPKGPCILEVLVVFLIHALMPYIALLQSGRQPSETKTFLDFLGCHQVILEEAEGLPPQRFVFASPDGPDDRTERNPRLNRLLVHTNRLGN